MTPKSREARLIMSLNKVICLGELLIDFVPVASGLPLSEVPEFQRAAGGAPANVAAAVAKLGGHSRFIGKVGRDAFGDYLERVLQECGVEPFVYRSDWANTTLAFVSLRMNGERDFAFYRDPGADMLLSVDEVTEEAMADGAIFHFGSISLIAEPSRSATVHAAQLARERGMIVSYDPNVRLSLWPDADQARRTIFGTLPLADLVKVSDEEAAFLTGEDDVSIAGRSLLSCGPKAVIVTEGENGCRWYEENGELHVPSFQVMPMDTTGAGDAFVGALLHQLARRGVSVSGLNVAVLGNENEIRDMLRFANAAGALATTRKGAIAAMPTEAEINAIYYG
jgi:fructokinase